MEPNAPLVEVGAKRLEFLLLLNAFELPVAPHEGDDDVAAMPPKDKEGALTA